MHQGANKLRQRARLSLYWPGMDRGIEEIAKTCSTCNELVPSHPREPLNPRPPASRPFEQVHADFAEVRNRHFLVIVDQYSGWPHVIPFGSTSTTAKQLVDAVRD